MLKVLAIEAGRQKRDAEHSQEEGDNPEANADLGFAPAAFLEVVVNGGHFKDALAVGKLEKADLHYDRHALDKIYDTAD